MATVLMMVLVVGYAWSVWLLWQQMHFEAPTGRAEGELRSSVLQLRATARHRRAFRKQLHS